MRISTSGMHHNALTAMLQQQSALSKVQNQIATGKRVQTPADDPVAAVHILELQRALQESDQYGKNADVARNRLSLEEQAMQDIGLVISLAREKAIQGNNATMDAAGRKMIATELRSRLGELVDIANRRDASGEYLFAGYSTGTPPFSNAVSGISYYGDQGNRMLQVGPAQRVADSHSGHDVFMKIPQGNGVFVLGGAIDNEGTAALGAGTVVDSDAWELAQDDYTIHFTSDTGDYEILDSSNVQVSVGNYTAGTVIEFNGIKIDMTGMPALDDTFTVSRSRTEDIFTTMRDLIDTLEGTTATNEAQLNTNIARVLQQLDHTEEHMLQVRAEVGVRLSSLDTAEASREDQKVELNRMRSELEDLDYAEAITRMNQQLIGLQAAQASYTRIAQLSLFNYLK